MEQGVWHFVITSQVVLISSIQPISSAISLNEVLHHYFDYLIRLLFYLIGRGDCIKVLSNEGGL